MLVVTGRAMKLTVSSAQCEETLVAHPSKTGVNAALESWEKSQQSLDINFRIFFLFFCSGEGKGEFEVPGGGGGRFLIEKPRRGKGVRKKEAGARGWRGWRVFAGIGEFGGGG